MQLAPIDYASPYYRDESLLLGMGIEPYELMLQLIAKNDDPFTGGRSYYAHPALKRNGFPTIPHQSAATGMQAIPATGMAQGIAYREQRGLLKKTDHGLPIVLCSMGDGAVTEGEVSEAFQMAVLKKLPILYLIQDNEWGISATGKEMRAMDAYAYAGGFKGLERMSVDGADFIDSYLGIQKAMEFVRNKRNPMLVHAKCPLLGHHTSGVRKEWYRSDLESHQKLDPMVRLRNVLLDLGEKEDKLQQIAEQALRKAQEDFERALLEPNENFATIVPRTAYI